MDFGSVGSKGKSDGTVVRLADGSGAKTCIQSHQVLVLHNQFIVHFYALSCMPSIALFSLEQSVRNTMKKISVVVAICLPLASLGQVVELSDHSLPRAKVLTWHAKCANGRLGVIRWDPTSTPPQLCAAVQDGSRAEQCVSINPAALNQVVRSVAQDLCK